MSQPTVEIEQAVIAATGARYVVGIDEAGRGALAGPVVAAAVILPLHRPETLRELDGVNDSKQLTPTDRDHFYDLICRHALSFGVGSTPSHIIDEIGIIPANVLAMEQALSALQPAGEYLLIDGRMRLRRVALPQQSIIRGDSLSLSIAAASILAKVSRDRHMIDLEAQFPQYGFARHKGYATPQHLASLAHYGPCAIHRHSFAPIRQPLL
jgi:ribonuclease HII